MVESIHSSALNGDLLAPQTHKQKLHEDLSELQSSIVWFKFLSKYLHNGKFVESECPISAVRSRALCQAGWEWSGASGELISSGDLMTHFYHNHYL